MATYIVTFEIPDARRRQAVRNKLMSYGIYCPIHEHCWAVVTEQTPSEIRDFLTTEMAASDRIFVIRSGTHAAWRNAYGEKNSTWLKERL